MEADEYWWAWETVHEGVSEGTLPIGVLDALLHHQEADDEFRGYVAAGPIEDALVYQVATYGTDIAERCATDPVWVQVMGGIWVSDLEWAALPRTLQARVPIPLIEKREAPGKKRGRRS